MNKLEKFSLNRYELRSFSYVYHIAADANLLQAMFGHNYRDNAQNLACHILRSVSDAVATAVDPAIVELGGAAVQLTLELGLPLVGSADDTIRFGGASQSNAFGNKATAGRSLLDLLSNPASGTLLLDKYGDVFVRGLLSGGSSGGENPGLECSVVTNVGNVALFLDACISSNNASNLQKLLLLVLNNVLSTVSSAGSSESSSFGSSFVYATLVPACVRRIANLSDDIVSVILEIDSYCAPADRSPSLFAHALKDVIAVLENPKSQVEAITTRLLRLPFLVSGTAVSAPRPLSQCPEDKSTTNKVTNILTS